MYDEGKKNVSFNWLSLIIKLLVLALVVFFLCWLFTRNKTKNTMGSSTDVYINNITSMKDAAFEYFTESRLPKEFGETKKLSLTKMLDQIML